MRLSKALRQRHKLILTCFFIACASGAKYYYDSCGGSWCELPLFDTAVRVLFGLALLVIVVVVVRVLMRFLGSARTNGFGAAPAEYDGRRIGIYGRVEHVFVESTSTKVKKSVTDIQRRLVGNSDARGRYPVQRFLLSSPALQQGQKMLVHRGAREGSLPLKKGNWVHVVGTYGHRPSRKGGNARSNANMYGSVYRTNEPQGQIEILRRKPDREEARRVEIDPQKVAEKSRAAGFQIASAKGPQSYFDTISKRSASFAVEGATTAGDLGEELVQKHIQQRIVAAGERCSGFLYRSVRVPRGSKYSPFEIDLLLVSRLGILAIEVKHWSGRVELADRGKWRQVRRDGTARTCGDMLALTERKVASLEKHFSRAGLSFARGIGRSIVVFSNPKIELSEQLLRLPGVMHLDDLDQVLDLLLPRTPDQLDSGRQLLAQDGVNSLARVVADLPRWDQVTLHGGRVLRGDIARETFFMEPGTASSIHGFSEFRFQIPRRFITAWFKRPMVYWRNVQGEERSRAIDPSASFRFDPAGEDPPLDVSYGNVVNVHLTARPEADASELLENSN